MKSFVKTLYERVIVNWKTTLLGLGGLSISIFTGVLLYQEKVSVEQLATAIPTIATGIASIYAIFHKETPPQ